MFVRDRKGMAIGPAGLPANGRLHRQRRRGIEPGRCTATALLRRDADHPADRVLLGFARFFRRLGRGSVLFANTTRGLGGRLLRFTGAATGRSFLLWGRRFVSMRTAAAARLALLWRAATANLLPAGVGSLPGRFRNRHPDGGDEVRQQRHAGAKPTAQNPANRLSEIKEHWQRNGSRRELPSSMT